MPPRTTPLSRSKPLGKGKRPNGTRKARKERGYSYEAFFEAIAHMDGYRCFVHHLLLKREEEGADFPLGLLLCEGVMDAHHLLPKQRLKQEFSSNGTLYGGGPDVRLGDVLSDPRNGILACRRHHDLVERRLVVVRAADLPQRFSAFCADYGLEGWQSRYYGEAAA